VKLNARDALRFCRSPDRRYKAALIYGEDGVEISRRRVQLINALLGEGENHNVTRLDVAQARRDTAIIMDALRSKGFFGGEPIVLIENGTDGLAAGLSETFASAEADDAFLIVTAGLLPARSKLRKLFEGEVSAIAAPCYQTALGRPEIEALLKDAGVSGIDEEAIHDLVDFARSTDSGALSDLISRLSLYALSSDTPVSSADIIECLPGSGDADLDDVVDAVADGDARSVGPLMNKLESQGVNPTTLAIFAMRKFRQIHMITSAGGPPDSVISRLRPPVFGPRRDRLLRQARLWTTTKCEGALKLILETDSALRGGAAAAGYPMLERMLIRLALGAKK